MYFHHRKTHTVLAAVAGNQEGDCPRTPISRPDILIYPSYLFSKAGCAKIGMYLFVVVFLFFLKKRCPSPFEAHLCTCMHSCVALALFGFVIFLENKFSPKSHYFYRLQQVSSRILLHSFNSLPSQTVQPVVKNIRILSGDGVFLQMYCGWITPNIALDIV